jgi:hypothetical protein
VDFYGDPSITCSGNPATSTSISYKIATGLTLARTSGGTISYVTGSTSGIDTPAGNPNPASHHMVVINSRFHDLGSGGIHALFADNIYWVGNVVYNTANADAYDFSGISLNSNINATYTNGAWDNTYGTIGGLQARNVIASNVAHHNGNLVSPVSDGNGIIIDSLNVGAGAQNTCNTTTYSYGTIVALNATHDNAGAGTHVFYSSNDAVLNNTSYNDRTSTLNSGTYRPAIDSNCGSGNLFYNNAVYTITGAGYLVANIGMGGVAEQNNGVNNRFNTNMVYVSGTLYGCNNFGASGNGDVCYNGFDGIFNSTQTAWASGTTYAQGNFVSGTNSHNYISLVASNLGNNPVTDGGVHWQDLGLGNNSFPTNPMFTNPAPSPPSSANPPSFILQSGSPALGASTAALTALGGPTVATPNIGAY